MANEFIKAEQVAAQMLGYLERDTVLLNYVWRDPVGDFRGAKDDTISIKVPGYTDARTRTMRAATPIVIDDLAETKVDVKLDTHVYKAIRITDEEMTLDIRNFGEQVTAPAMSSVVRKVDSVLGTAMVAATPEVTMLVDEDDPYNSLVDARERLNLHGVPHGQRFALVGARVESAILKSDRLSKFDQSGSSEALREAVIGRMAGFTIVSGPTLNPDKAIVAHRTAFAASLVAPVVPGGAAWGAVQSHRGLQLRVLRDYLPDDASGPADRLLTDTFMGVSVVKDNGSIDGDGFFVPDPEAPAKLVRAVELTLVSSS